MSGAEEEPGEDNGAEIDVEALLAQPAEQKETENPHDQDPDLEVPPEEDEEPEGGVPEAGGQPIGASCRRRFTAVHNQGTRPLSRITHIVLHSTEGGTAAGAATWFANPASRGSAHLCVDDHECFRTLDDARIPKGAPGVNTDGFHIEHAGFARWRRQKWMSHEQTLRRGAFKAAFHAVKFGVPLRLLTANDLRHGRSGFVTHATVSQAFTPGGHTDPGRGFPLDHYMRLVKEFVREIQS
jgi:N-acetylmuramoyl-L-alanine amidase